LPIILVRRNNSHFLEEVPAMLTSAYSQSKARHTVVVERLSNRISSRIICRLHLPLPISVSTIWQVITSKLQGSATRERRSCYRRDFWAMTSSHSIFTIPTLRHDSLRPRHRWPLISDTRDLSVRVDSMQWKVQRRKTRWKIAERASSAGRVQCRARAMKQWLSMGNCRARLFSTCSCRCRRKMHRINLCRWTAKWKVLQLITTMAIESAIINSKFKFINLRL